MRRLTVALLTLALLAPHAPASAARVGSIEGRAINGTTRRPQPGVEVTLTQGTADATEQQTVTTDRRGRYSFDDLPTGDDVFYVLDARYEEGLFAGSPLMIPADTPEQPVIDTTLRVWEPTTDPSAILLRRNDMFAVQDGDRVSIIESVTVVNPTQSAYIGRGAGMQTEGGTGSDAGPTPSLGFALPDGALLETFEWREADLDVPEVVQVPDFGFAITNAIPPGEVKFAFSYQVEGNGGTFDLSRTALYAISDMSVFAAEPLEVTGNRLVPDGEEELEGITYQRSSATERIDAADPVQILLIAEGGSSPMLLAGAAAGLLLLLLGSAWVFSRTKRSRRKPVAAVAASPLAEPVPDRDGLVTAIAELDLQHGSGAISDEDYQRKRAELKERLLTERERVG